MAIIRGLGAVTVFFSIAAGPLAEYYIHVYLAGATTSTSGHKIILYTTTSGEKRTRRDPRQISRMY